MPFPVLTVTRVVLSSGGSCHLDRAQGAAPRSARVAARVTPTGVQGKGSLTNVSVEAVSRADCATSAP